jgi:hypothetical protein
MLKVKVSINIILLSSITLSNLFDVTCTVIMDITGVMQTYCRKNKKVLFMMVMTK